MREGRPSRTAAWVAAARSGMGVELPEGTRLCDDPYGLLFAGPLYSGAAEPFSRPLRSLLMRTTPMQRFVFWMQLRTRYLDDVLLGFVRRGGRQVVLLGAGFDTRAIRLRPQLEGAIVYEVDHPATQAHKREVFERGHVPLEETRLVAMNFEKEPVSDLRARLAAIGHDAHQPTLTIWEGVTMYLTDAAIEASLRAVHDYTGPGGSLAFTYFDRAHVGRKTPFNRMTRRIVSRVGEPWRFSGWDPAALAGWLAPHGFDLVENPNEVELAKRYLPPRYARVMKSSGRYIAVASWTQSHRK